MSTKVDPELLKDVKQKHQLAHVDTEEKNPLPTAKGNSITIKLTIRNRLAEPPYHHEQKVTLGAGKPLIRFLEKAADENKDFEFSIAYYAKLGYFIETVGNLSKVGSICPAPGYYWEFVLAPSTPLSVGVSSYIPKDGDDIIMDYVLEK